MCDSLKVLLKECNERIKILNEDRLISNEKKRVLIKENNRIIVRIQQLLLLDLTKHDKHYFKCDVCGKFISYDDFEKGKVKTDYTPETPFECERITHVHRRCPHEL